MNDYTNIIADIRKLAEGKQPGGDIAKLLYEHGCFYLLSKISERNEYTQRLQAESQLNKICIRERYTVCQPLFEMLEQRRIPYAVIKGAVLSQAAYSDISVRKSGDIDFLIRRDDIDAVKSFMLQSGFVQGRVTEAGIVPFTRRELIFQASLSHQAAPFVIEGKNPMCPYINVDVNMDILWGESGRYSDMDFILSQTQSMDIHGIAVRKLSPAVEFIALCLHHYKDMNSIYLLAEGNFKLSLFCDIYFYLKHNAIDTDELKEVGEKLNITEFMYYCIFYAEKVFLGALETTKSEDILYTFGLDDEERTLWSVSFEERLFSESFNEMFTGHLNDKDKEKIRMNLLMT